MDPVQLFFLEYTQVGVLYIEEITATHLQARRQQKQLFYYNPLRTHSTTDTKIIPFEQPCTTHSGSCPA